MVGFSLRIRGGVVDDDAEDESGSSEEKECGHDIFLFPHGSIPPVFIPHFAEIYAGDIISQNPEKSIATGKTLSRGIMINVNE